jgi:hypothetical protein
MANVQDQFSSVGSSRYAAECKRLARLARSGTPVTVASVARKADEMRGKWLNHIWSLSPKHFLTHANL